MWQPGIAVASKSEVCISWNLQCCEMVPRLLPAIISKCEIQAAVASSHERHGEGKATGPWGLTQHPRWGPGHTAAFPEEVHLQNDLWTFHWWAFSRLFLLPWMPLAFSTLHLAVSVWICVAFDGLGIVTVKSRCLVCRCLVCRRHTCTGTLSICTRFWQACCACWVSCREELVLHWKNHPMVLYYLLLTTVTKCLRLIAFFMNKRHILVHSSRGSEASACFHGGPGGRWHQNSDMRMHNWCLMVSSSPRREI